ncbi:MAG: peptidase S41 [Robiginitomaculum sp.]|nr:MAG: peptidase S41 [Robiginitomaculum sp.]
MKFTSLVALGAALGVSAATFAEPNSNENAHSYYQLVIFADVLSRVQDEYIEDVDPADLVADALNGALRSLDPHSHYSPPKDFERQQEISRREYGGLGIEVSMQDGFILVGYANKGAPAARSGIKAGDLITHVEGVSIKDKDLSEAVEKMRGLAGDPITITVKTAEDEPRDIIVVREVVQGRAVRNRMFEGMGYIYLETFNNANVARDLGEAIDILEAEHGGKLPGLVLDLRGNGGGLLTQSVAVSSYFLDGGEVLSVRGRRAADNDRYHAERGEKLAGVPVVVLISGTSASASEIVAGALQDRGRALIVGTQSFGKGSVQSVYPLNNGKDGALRLTTDRYFTPSGRSIQGLGITPDIWVEAFPDTGQNRITFRESSLANSLDAIILETEGNPKTHKDVEHEYPPEDWASDQDYQLHRAVEVLKAEDFKSRLQHAFND